MAHLASSGYCLMAHLASPDYRLMAHLASPDYRLMTHLAVDWRIPPDSEAPGILTSDSFTDSTLTVPSGVTLTPSPVLTLIGRAEGGSLCFWALRAKTPE